MKKDLVEILACPACKHYPLKLTVEREANEEVIDGMSACASCGARYPIEEGIPNLLPPE